MFTFQNRVYYDLIKELKGNVSIPSTIDSPWLQTPEVDFVSVLHHPEFQLDNTTELSKRLDMEQVRKIVAEKFDPTEYYKGDNVPPPIRRPTGHSHSPYWIFGGILALLALGIGISVFLYCFCGRMIADCFLRKDRGRTTMSNPDFQPLMSNIEMRPVIPMPANSGRLVIQDEGSSQNRARVRFLLPRRESELEYEEDDGGHQLTRAAVRPEQSRPGSGTTEQRVSHISENPVQWGQTLARRKEQKARQAKQSMPPVGTMVMGMAAASLPGVEGQEDYDHPITVLHGPSPLPDRSMFLFILNMLTLVVILLILARKMHMLMRQVRRIKYKASNFLSMLFNLNIKAKAKIYVEVSNFENCVYLPVVDITVPPRDLYFLKRKGREPRCGLESSCCNSQLQFKWKKACLIASSRSHKDVILTLPAVINVPQSSKYLLMKILAGNYIIDMLILHPNSLCERIRVLLSEQTVETPVSMIPLDEEETSAPTSSTPNTNTEASADSDNTGTHGQYYVVNMEGHKGGTKLKLAVPRDRPSEIV